MSLLLDIINYFVASGICTGDGIDCFRDFMPEAPDNVVVLNEYSGDSISPFTTHVHRSVQVVVRGVDADSARANAIQICNAFRTENEDRRIDFSSESWGQVYVRQPPFKLSQDERDRVSYCFNLGITTTTLE